MADSNQTLAKRVRSLRPDWSWNDCRAAISQNKVTVNGDVITDPACRPETNANVCLHDKPQLNAHARPTDTLNAKSQTNIHVYFADAHIIVVEKPSGIESVPYSTKKNQDDASKKWQHDTMIDLARKWLEVKENKKLPPLKVVHRLDKGTSGVMVFARTTLAERNLGTLFRTHDITRSYVAICLGIPTPGTITTRLVENRGDGRRGATENKKLGKHAVTHVTVVETRKSPKGRPVSMITCRLETGRTHQIRIHLAESGHSLCGETVYLSKTPHAEPITDTSNAPRIALHAHELGFIHPVTRENLHWTSPLASDLNAWWDKLKV